MRARLPLPPPRSLALIPAVVNRDPVSRSVPRHRVCPVSPSGDRYRNALKNAVAALGLTCGPICSPSEETILPSWSGVTPALLR